MGAVARGPARHRGFPLPGPCFDIASLISTFGEKGVCFSYAHTSTRW